MQIKILASKQEDESTCYLCEGSLKNYIDSLPEDYDEYDVQRGIVNNLYLDKIWEDVILRHHIPPITLITRNRKFDENDLSEFRILDGLQRTYRIKRIYKMLEFIISNQEFFLDPKVTIRSIRIKFKDEIEELNAKALEILNVVDKVKKEKLSFETIMDVFNEKQWFEIWHNLTYEQEVQKMLILNAGHKPMSNYHQLELLFLNQLPIIKENYPEIEIQRGREITPLTYAKVREQNKYYFAHLIEAMISFIEKEPITLNAGLLQRLQQDESKESLFLLNNTDFIDEFMDFVIKFDAHLSKNYNDTGVKWISKDTVLSSVLAEISLNNKDDLTNKKLFDNFLKLLDAIPEALNIDGFNEERKGMDISSINIGKFTKKCVQEGIREFITSASVIDWHLIFSSELGK